jgi:hypothetical protein
MNLLILCPGKIPKSTDDIRCFTDVLNFYLPNAIKEYAECTILQIPSEDDTELKQLFSTLDVNKYSAIITLGLRFYSRISKETTNLLKSRFNGVFCQTHDGSRLDHDPVDITFTFKNDDERLSTNRHWYDRHKKHNVYMGWAADPKLNYPNQSTEELRILVDHTNYGENPIDETSEILKSIKEFVDSEIWRPNFKSVSVRRFDSGKVIDVDFNNINEITRYDRSTVSINEISKEHSKAHLFCVTHPESVGLVVLETALAGALTVTKKGFIPKDRLETVRHYEYIEDINWRQVFNMIDPALSRSVAIENSWEAVAKRIINALKDKQSHE